MTEWHKADPVRLAISVDDPVLADRLAALLSVIPGLQIVTEDPDVTVRGQSRLSETSLADPLTPREHEVLALLAEGASNKTIARELGISIHTAKFHVRSVFDKVDAVGRTDAVAQAARQRLIEL